MRSPNLAAAASNHNPEPLPAPLGNLDADLTGLPWPGLPLDLWDSDAAHAATGEVRDIAAQLCRHAFYGAPAGSLPDDIERLAHLANTSPCKLRRRWPIVSAILQLVRDADGRLWCAIVMPMVNTAWKRRLVVRDKARARAVRRWNPIAAPRRNAPKTKRFSSVFETKPEQNQRSADATVEVEGMGLSTETHTRIIKEASSEAAACAPLGGTHTAPVVGHPPNPAGPELAERQPPSHQPAAIRAIRTEDDGGRCAGGPEPAIGVAMVAPADPVPAPPAAEPSICVRTQCRVRPQVPDQLVLGIEQEPIGTAQALRNQVVVDQPAGTTAQVTGPRLVVRFKS